MQLGADMRVDLEALPTSTAIGLTASFVGAAIATLPVRLALERPADDPGAGAGEAKLDLYADGSSVFVSGTVKGWLEVACSRCLGPARVPIEETLRVTYLPQAEVPHDLEDAEGGDAGSVEAGQDALDVYGYDGEIIDLEPLLREQVVLSVPYAPLCKEDCRGLCPGCGVDRNATPCACAPPLDPRFAVLKSLKV